MCGKFAKRNITASLYKGKQLALIKPCKTVNFWAFSALDELDPNVGLDPRVCVFNFLSVIIATSYYKRDTNLF